MQIMSTVCDQYIMPTSQFFWIGLLLTFVVVSAVEDENRPANSWEDYKAAYNKKYDTEEEDIKRKILFEERLDAIHYHNARYEEGLVSYKMGVNQFTDRTEKESQAMFSSIKLARSSKGSGSDVKYVPNPLVKIVHSLDLRDRGMVTPVQKALQCAYDVFGPLGALEGQYKKKTGKLRALSAQHLLDCGTYDCLLANSTYVYDHVQKHGILPEKDYPMYTGVPQSCRASNTSELIQTNGRASVAGSMKIVLQALNEIGPLSFSLNSVGLVDYNSGILSEDFKCGSIKSAHQATLIGYGTDNGTDYFLAKNSWGPEWGENGFFRFKRGINFCKWNEIRFPILK